MTEKSTLPGYTGYDVLRPETQEDFERRRNWFDHCEWVRNHQGCEVYLAYCESHHNGDPYYHTLIYRKHPPREAETVSGEKV